MDPGDVEELIEEALPDATAEVRRARGPHDDDHLAAEVVSPSFEGESLVDRHDAVHDALGDHLTTDIHAIELRTYTPEEFDEETG
ncbi:BolA family transcriptional regulator [Halobacteriales archaeon QS_8_69_26]|nr:MAG: BolA family transcriptional regulator [Halobacteriales archaeon QS_8_69_26]